MTSPRSGLAAASMLSDVGKLTYPRSDMKTAMIMLVWVLVVAGLIGIAFILTTTV